jgi:hypothetical protein
MPPPGIGGGAPAPMPGGRTLATLGAIGGAPMPEAKPPLGAPIPLPAIAVGGRPALMPAPPIFFDPGPAIALFLAMGASYLRETKLFTKAIFKIKLLVHIPYEYPAHDHRSTFVCLLTAFFVSSGG